MDLDEVANTLSVPRAQVYALVRTGRLRAIKIGGRGVWRVERCALEAFITAVDAATAQLVDGDVAGELPRGRDA
jgi:excisionase family DNA binding protein